MLINANGQLVTADGSIVNGENGPIVFQPNDRQISISPDGRVEVLEGITNTETERGKLRLVSFAQPQNLQSEGNNLFSATAEAGARPATRAVTVIQGAIEGSNVNGVREMTKMVDINRTYSMIASMMQTQDDTKTIDRLADVSA